MEIINLISDFRRSGINLSLQNGKIRVRPKEKITELIRNQIAEHRRDLIIYLQVELACNGLSITPTQVITRLLSVEDEQDLVNEETPQEALTLHIKLWLAKGMPHYSGKPINKTLDKSALSFNHNLEISSSHASNPDCDILSNFFNKAELGGLELLADDKQWLRSLGYISMSEKRLDQYMKCWLDAMNNEKIDFKKQNKGRFAANTFIREIMENGD